FFNQTSIYDSTMESNGAMMEGTTYDVKRGKLRHEMPQSRQRNDTRNGFRPMSSHIP
ncbi:hypothetical protein J6590_023089, partial [Homalodisca vitripennis]